MPASWVVDEDKWTKAKQRAKEQGRAKDYAYITGIYKQMGGRIRKESKKSGQTFSEVVAGAKWQNENVWGKIDKLHAHVDKLVGGLADNATPEDFPWDVLRDGARVELEHTTDPAIATEIAMDHLMEDIDYYKKLKKIEHNPGNPHKRKPCKKSEAGSFSEILQKAAAAAPAGVPVVARRGALRTPRPPQPSASAPGLESKTRGLPIGTERVWGGRKYKKTGPGKWIPVSEKMTGAFEGLERKVTEKERETGQRSTGGALAVGARGGRITPTTGAPQYKPGMVKEVVSKILDSLKDLLGKQEKKEAPTKIEKPKSKKHGVDMVNELKGGEPLEQLEELKEDLEGTLARMFPGDPHYQEYKDAVGKLDDFIAVQQEEHQGRRERSVEFEEKKKELDEREAALKETPKGEKAPDWVVEADKKKAEKEVQKKAKAEAKGKDEKEAKKKEARKKRTQEVLAKIGPKEDSKPKPTEEKAPPPKPAAKPKPAAEKKPAAKKKPAPKLVVKKEKKPEPLRLQKKRAARGAPIKDPKTSADHRILADHYKKRAAAAKKKGRDDLHKLYHNMKKDHQRKARRAEKAPPPKPAAKPKPEPPPKPKRASKPKQVAQKSALEQWADEMLTKSVDRRG
jgi:hypothetical protein